MPSTTINSAIKRNLLEIWHYKRRLYLAAQVLTTGHGFVPGVRAVDRFADLPGALAETFNRAIREALAETLPDTGEAQEKEFARLTGQPADFSWRRDFARGNAMDIQLAWWPERWEIWLAFPSGPYRGIYSGRPPFRCSPEAPVEALALVICELITEHTRKDRLVGEKADWRDGLANVGRIYEVSPPWWDLARKEWPVHETVQQILDKRLPAGVVAPAAQSDRLWFIVPAGHSLGPTEAQRLADEVTSELERLKPAEIA